MTLTTASGYFKKGVKILGVFAVLYYVVIFFALPKAKLALRKLIPERNPATVLYGSLPRLKFESKKLDTSGGITYELNTKGGKLPTKIPRNVVVYKFKKPEFSYLKGKNAEDSAAVLGFSPNDMLTDLNSQVYKWRSLKTGGILTINTDTKELTLENNLTSITSTISQTSVLTESSAEQSARSLFQSLARYNPVYYDKGVAKVFLGKLVGSRITPVTSGEEGNIAKVSLYKKIGTIPVVTPDITKGLLYTIVTAQPSPYSFPVVEAYYWNIESDTKATYPIYYVDEAWEFIKQNKGIVSSVRPVDYNPFETYKTERVEKVYINNIFLAYYETPEYQEYLQPIYVFEGKYSTRGTQGGEITLYYPGVIAEFIK